MSLSQSHHSPSLQPLLLAHLLLPPYAGYRFGEMSWAENFHDLLTPLRNRYYYGWNTLFFLLFTTVAILGCFSVVSQRIKPVKFVQVHYINSVCLLAIDRVPFYVGLHNLNKLLFVCVFRSYGGFLVKINELDCTWKGIYSGWPHYSGIRCKSSIWSRIFNGWERFEKIMNLTNHVIWRISKLCVLICEHLYRSLC